MKCMILFASPRPFIRNRYTSYRLGTDITPPYSRYGLVGLDNFTKKACVAPLHSNNPGSLIEGTNNFITHVHREA